VRKLRLDELRRFWPETISREGNDRRLRCRQNPKSGSAITIAQPKMPTNDGYLAANESNLNCLPITHAPQNEIFA
jgi:hypothetical protein